jgi:hypothetical protein
MLALIVLGLVTAVTLVFALAAYLLDRGEASLEEQEHGGETERSNEANQDRATAAKLAGL